MKDVMEGWVTVESFWYWMLVVRLELGVRAFVMFS